VYLDPANENFRPIIPAENDEFRIMAVVKAVIRKY
jgi:SOS-response transcriptional repressor LexA